MFKKALLLTLTLSCAELFAQQVSSIFGADLRQKLKTHDYPYSALAKLEFSDGGHCTGALIDRDLILTNAHCVRDEHGRRRQRISALLHGLKGVSVRVRGVEVMVGTENYPDNPQADWALIRIERPYGDVFGHFHLKSDYELGDFYTLAGYSGDFAGGNSAGVHESCALKSYLGPFSLLTHNCHMTKGASGAPIWRLDEDGRAQVYALNSAQRGQQDYHDEWQLADTNFAVPVENFAQAIKEITSDDQAFAPGLVICNQKEKSVKLALGYKTAEHTIARGWERIPAHSCREVRLPKAIIETNQEAVVYAYDKDDDVAGTYYREFCVGTALFSFEREGLSCKAKRFFTRIGKLRTKTINRLDIR